MEEPGFIRWGEGGLNGEVEGPERGWEGWGRKAVFVVRKWGREGVAGEED